MNKKPSARWALAVVTTLWAVGIWYVVAGAASEREPTDEQTCMPLPDCILNPSEEPSESPSPSPSRSRSPRPSRSPSRSPSQSPSRSPSQSPSESPSESPSQSPSQSPSRSPSQSPSESPSESPPATIFYPSRATIKYDRGADDFKGGVASDNARCERRRAVKVFKQRRGRDRSIGSDRTNRRGRWNVGKKRVGGAYYAVAKRSQFTDSSGRVATCQRDRSRTIQVRRRRG